LGKKIVGLVTVLTYNILAEVYANENSEIDPCQVEKTMYYATASHG